MTPMLFPASDSSGEAQRWQRGVTGAQPHLQRDTDRVVPGWIRPQQDEGAAALRKKGQPEGGRGFYGKMGSGG